MQNHSMQGGGAAGRYVLPPPGTQGQSPPGLAPLPPGYGMPGLRFDPQTGQPMFLPHPHHMMYLPGYQATSPSARPDTTSERQSLDKSLELHSPIATKSPTEEPSVMLCITKADLDRPEVKNLLSAEDIETLTRNNVKTEPEPEAEGGVGDSGDDSNAQAQQQSQPKKSRKKKTRKEPDAAPPPPPSDSGSVSEHSSSDSDSEVEPVIKKGNK